MKTQAGSMAQMVKSLLSKTWSFHFKPQYGKRKKKKNTYEKNIIGKKEKKNT
jgi:hypothetical protein